MSKQERNRRGDDARVDLQASHEASGGPPRDVSEGQYSPRDARDGLHPPRDARDGLHPPRDARDGLHPPRDARDGLKETAIDCFSRYGYQGTSIDRIAREAGVTKGAIYYHFKDKDDLLAAAVADRVAEFEDRVQRAVEGCGAEESLHRVVHVAVSHALSNDRPRFAIKLMVEAIDTHDTLRDAMRRMMQRYRAFVRNIIRKGQESGHFRADADAEGLAATLTSAVIGGETQYYLDPERFRLEETMQIFIEALCRDLRVADSQTGSTPDNRRSPETPA
jgi:AcrR family transcriptional regulator